MEIIAWSDGNPYYLDERQEKCYAYHPDHEGLARCIGNDAPHLCLTCGVQCLVDSQMPSNICPGCKARTLVPTTELDGRCCPACKTGRFVADPECYAIS